MKPGISRDLPILPFAVVGIGVKTNQCTGDGRQDHNPEDPNIRFAPSFEPVGTEPCLKAEANHRSASDSRKSCIEPVADDPFLTALSHDRPPFKKNKGKMPNPNHSLIRSVQTLILRALHNRRIRSGDLLVKPLFPLLKIVERIFWCPRFS